MADHLKVLLDDVSIHSDTVEISSKKMLDNTKENVGSNEHIVHSIANITDNLTE